MVLGVYVEVPGGNFEVIGDYIGIRRAYIEIITDHVKAKLRTL